MNMNRKQATVNYSPKIGPEPRWTSFSRLEEGSMGNFQNLSTEFLKHYSMLIEDEATMANLWNTQQTDSETLKSYMTRFKSVTAKILNVNNDSALTALKNGLW